MRKLIIAATAAALLSVAGPAFAGPGGTSDYEGTGTDANNVHCGADAAPLPGTNVQVNTAGSEAGGAAVVCNDGAPVPVQGRVMASGSPSGGGWIAADGDRDNEGTAADGWARVDFGPSASANKVRCGGPEGGWNAESANGGNSSYCG